MKYLCLVYCNEEKLHSLPESSEDAECMACIEVRPVRELTSHA